MEEKKQQYSALTIDRAAFLLLRVKKAFKKKKLQRKEREKAAQLANANRIDQRASCAGLEDAQRSSKKVPPPLLRSRTLPAIIVPGVNILQAQIGNKDVIQPLPSFQSSSAKPRFYPSRMSFAVSRDIESVSLESRRKSAVSKLCVGGSFGPERAFDGSPLLRVPTLPKSKATSNTTAFNRLSKFLNNSKTPPPVPESDDDGNVIRRLSWERKDNNNSIRIPRSSSIDSMVEAVWAETYEAPIYCPPPRTPGSEKRLSISSRTSDRTLALVSPSVGRRLKGQRSVNALFAAIEHGHTEKAQTILESTDVDVNCVNSDGLTPLDVAVLSNNRSLVKMLISFGAKENSQYMSPEQLGSHLKQLYGEAELRLQEYSGRIDLDPSMSSTRASFSTMIGSTSSSAVTGCTGGDSEKQAVLWSRRAKVLKRLVLGFNQARPPDPPSMVAVDITSTDSVTVRLKESLSLDSSITTKFLVQWSTRSDFAQPLAGEVEILDMSKSTCRIQLSHGKRFYFRACCGNFKGYGGYLTSMPPSVVPSSWRDVGEHQERYIGKDLELESLLEEVKSIRPGCEMLECQMNQRRGQKKKTSIKQLFSAASKFQKNLRRGIFLACILYHEDKVLVTNEDFLPVIEIDESFPLNCINTDLHWFMKVACNWDDIKSLKADMDRTGSSGIHFRQKLLGAALQMQSALCLQDLGQIYHKPIRDAQGTMVLTTINYVKNPKSVSVLNSRWLPMNKVFKKCHLSDDHNVNELLMASIQEQINYHQASSLKLVRGLYLLYLKMQSSVDLIQVVTTVKNPNVMPHCKIRDNPHVSAEEWSYLRNQTYASSSCSLSGNEQQRAFLELITAAAKRLLNFMNISSEDAANHRLYATEVVDLTEDVSFIVMCPSAEQSCSVPGQREMLLQRPEILSLPIQVFEMIHLRTYHEPIIQQYSRLSCVLELDQATANHLHREAFSNSEVAAAKEKVQKLQDLQGKLNAIWRHVRWLMDVITFARDRQDEGLPLKVILDQSKEDLTVKTNHLQLPSKVIKSSPGRGSWPGPGTSHNSSLVSNEFSKSEQQLCKNSDCSESRRSTPRKNSDNSFASGEIYNECLVPSRSEDMLFAPSATTSPLVRPYSLLSVADSTQSLSSESDCLVSSNSSIANGRKGAAKIPPSKSMTNVKKQQLLHEKLLMKSPNRNLCESEHLSKSLTNISENKKMDQQGPGILQVYAAYDTGLASGTSLKLHVTPKTTAREVVDLVVKQLNMAVVLKGKEGPIYPADKLKNFCLVAVIGARERCLRDDFKPLQLQNPWKKGRLYVRQKQEVLAALEHSTKLSNII